MKKLVGKYFLGHETVAVYVDPSLDGAEARTPGEWAGAGKLETGQLILGMKGKNWAGMLEHALHEAEEYLLAKAKGRYQPSLYISGDTNNCIFVIDHVAYTQMIAATAEFLAPLLTPLWKAYRENKKKR